MNTASIITISLGAVSAIAAAISAYLSYKSSKITLELFQKEKFIKLEDELSKVIEIAIAYPYVESKSFTYMWNNYKENGATDEKENEQYLRYDMYCNLLYNHLLHAFIFFEHDKQKIENFVDIKSWIRLHKQNWLNPVEDNENIDGYSKEFRDFISSYII
jgi:hypothetical protein